MDGFLLVIVSSIVLGIVGFGFVKYTDQINDSKHKKVSH
ncbi:MAG: hypothetical protein RL708_744 [Bacteroidota bacterium]|jgi:hypothetical protein